MIELQAQHFITYNSEPDSCAVCFIPAKNCHCKNQIN